MARAAICGARLNREQWTGFHVLVQAALQKGDPAGIKPFVLKAGAILKKCEPDAGWDK